MNFEIQPIFQPRGLYIQSQTTINYCVVYRVSFAQLFCVNLNLTSITVQYCNVLHTILQVLLTAPYNQSQAWPTTKPNTSPHPQLPLPSFHF